MTSKSTTAEKLTKHRKALLAKLRTRSNRYSSYRIAIETLNFMKEVVGTGRYDNVEQLIGLLKGEREELVAAEPTEFVMSNVVLSVLKMIREESIKKSESNESTCISTLFTFGEAQRTGEKRVDSRSLRKFALAAIGEFQMEMETCRENMCAQAVDHVCSSDVVMTLGLSTSDTLRSFFEAARAAHRSFRLLAVDDEQDCEHAEHLASVDVLAAMRRTTKVVIAAVALLPDGSCIAPAGSLAICLAAKRHCVPVSVCAAFYKITPCFMPGLELFPSLGSPSGMVPFFESDSLSKVRLMNPLFDLIPAQLVFLYISHTSAMSPSHVYRLVTEYYHQEDINHMSVS